MRGTIPPRERRHFKACGGIDNTALGFQALFHNNTGNNNTAGGFRALFANTNGHQNTATGVSALVSNTTGNFNTANGVNALNHNNGGDKRPPACKRSFSNDIGRPQHGHRLCCSLSQYHWKPELRFWSYALSKISMAITTAPSVMLHLHRTPTGAATPPTVLRRSSATSTETIQPTGISALTATTAVSIHCTGQSALNHTSGISTLLLAVKHCLTIALAVSTRLLVGTRFANNSAATTRPSAMAHSPIALAATTSRWAQTPAPTSLQPTT